MTSQHSATPPDYDSVDARTEVYDERRHHPGHASTRREGRQTNKAPLVTRFEYYDIAHLGIALIVSLLVGLVYILVHGLIPGAYTGFEQSAVEDFFSLGSLRGFRAVASIVFVGMLSYKPLMETASRGWVMDIFAALVAAAVVHSFRDSAPDGFLSTYYTLPMVAVVLSARIPLLPLVVAPIVMLILGGQTEPQLDEFGSKAANFVRSADFGIHLAHGVAYGLTATATSVLGLVARRRLATITNARGE